MSQRAKFVLAVSITLAIAAFVFYRVVLPTPGEKAAERVAQLKEDARVECQTLYDDFDDGDPAEEALSAYYKRHGFESRVLHFMKDECPSTYEALKALVDENYEDAVRQLNDSTVEAPTWESEDCAERYAAASSDRFTAEESETLREAVDMDCANLSPSD
jgi:hypothetical protein